MCFCCFWVVIESRKIREGWSRTLTLLLPLISHLHFWLFFFCLFFVFPICMEISLHSEWIWRRWWHPHSSTLAWKIPWTEEPDRLQSMGSRRVGHLLNDFTFTFHFHALEKEMTAHSRVLAWRIPGTGEPGGLPSMGSHRVGHDWSDLAAAAVSESLNNDVMCFTEIVISPSNTQAHTHTNMYACACMCVYKIYMPL